VAASVIKLLESSILELSQQVEVDTPRGRGRLFLGTDDGSEIEKIFTVAMYDGYMFEFPIDKLRLTANITMSRTPQKCGLPLIPTGLSPLWYGCFHINSCLHFLHSGIHNTS